MDLTSKAETERSSHATETERFVERLRRRWETTLQTSISLTFDEIPQSASIESMNRENRVFVASTFSDAKLGRRGVLLSRSSVDFLIDQTLGGFQPDVADDSDAEEVGFPRRLTTLEKRLLQKIVAQTFEPFFFENLDSESDADEADAATESSRFDDETQIEIVEDSVPFWLLDERTKTVALNVCARNFSDRVSLFFDEQTERRLFPGLVSDRSESSNAERSEAVSSEVVVEIGRLKISPSRLSNLKVGDVLTSDVSADSLFLVKIDGEPRFWGRPGLYRNVPAVQIEKDFP